MIQRRHILYGLFMLVLAAGPATAERDMPAGADAGNAVCVEPAKAGFTATATTALMDREVGGVQIDDEALGRISGGAILFAPPDVAGQRLFAIILWDEVKSRRSASYEQGNGQITSIISVQQYK